MKKIIPLIIALSLAGLGGASAQSNYFKTIDSSEMNLGYFSAYDLPSAGGGLFSFGSQPLSELMATFSDTSTVTVSPNTIPNTSSDWYTPAGQVGATGNKIMVSYLYGQGSLIGGSQFEFSGVVNQFNLGTNASGFPYSLSVLIQDFASDWSSANTYSVPVTGTGNFSLNAILGDGQRNVQWGLELTGPNIWYENTEELEIAGSVTVEAIPEPSTYALLGLAAAGGLLVRRFRRKA